MKRLLLILQICLLCVIPAFSQEKVSPELQILQAQIPALLRQQRYGEVISIAERIVKIERQSGEKTAGYFTAQLNLARWKGQRLERAQAGMKTGISDFAKELDETRDLFDNVVALGREIGDPLPLATAQYESASFRQRLGSNAPEVESLFSQSLALREKYLPAGDELTITTMDKLTQVYFYQGAFEKFLPLNEDLIEVIEKKHGAEDSRLISPLSLYAGFLAMTDRAADAARVEQRITQVTGKPFKAEVNWVVLGRGESKLDLEFGTPSAMLPSDPIMGSRLANVRMSNGLTPAGSIVGVRYTLDVVGVPVNLVNRTPRDPATQSIAVAVLIDKTGSVLEVTPETDDARLAGKIRSRLLNWKFKPFVYEGVAEKMRGRFIVNYYK